MKHFVMITGPPKIPLAPQTEQFGRQLYLVPAQITLYTESTGNLSETNYGYGSLIPSRMVSIVIMKLNSGNAAINQRIHAETLYRNRMRPNTTRTRSIRTTPPKGTDYYCYNYYYLFLLHEFINNKCFFFFFF
jgi:hypothetical protein